MTFTLRQYQQEFADAIIKNLGRYKRVIACAATGAGKSKTFIYLAQRAMRRGLTVLILTESSKIFSQITGELRAGNIDSNVKDQHIQPGQIYIAMAQTLARRPRMIELFRGELSNLLVITDEAHIGTPTKLLLQLPAALHIGFTATPDWRAAKHLPLLYNACVVGPQPSQLVQSGHLMPYQHYARVLADLDDLKIKNGEFTEESQEKIFESKKVYTGLIEDITKLTYKKAMIFTASIKHCEDVVRMLQENNIPCIQAHSKVEKAKQSYDFNQYTDGPINVAVSVGTLTKGWDFPPLDLVIIFRATTSLPLYMQMIGRGSRPSPYTGKTTFTVLDYGGNYQRHGLWDAEVNWAEKWKERKGKKKEMAAPVKNCPECDYINPASALRCKNCGHEFEKTSNVSNEETKLIEITEKYRRLVGCKISELNEDQLAVYAKLKNKRPYATRVARAHVQKGRTEFLKNYGIAMGYKPMWGYFQALQITSDPIEYHDIILK